MQKIADQLEELNSDGFVDQRMFGLEGSKVKESLAGVKYYLNNGGNKFPKDYVLRETVDFYGESFNVYENPNCLPLAYAFDRAFYSSDLEKLYYSDDEEVIRKAVPADSVVYGNDTVTCHITLDVDSVVMLAIPYSDGWSVTIDDSPATVYNSDIYYMAVNARAGEHTLVYSHSAYR